MKLNYKKIIFIICMLLPGLSYAAMPGVTVVNDLGAKTTYALSMQIILLMTVLTILPAILLCMTSFTRIIIVFSILRQALGMPQTPNNQILIGLSLFLTLFIMAPVFEEVNNISVQPFVEEKINLKQAIENASLPIKEFMLAQTRENDLTVFAELMYGNGDQTAADTATQDKHPAQKNIVDKLEHKFDKGTIKASEVSFSILLPAFITSELKTAFQIGFMLFIPFMVIDLVVASVLMAMGMMMLSPLIISLPFKIMLFILVDGWALIVSTLANSFGG